MPNGYRDALRIGLPLVISMASSTVMQFTDRLFLSQYSMDAIAAAFPAAMANLLFLLFFTGVSGYTNVFIAQYCGSDAPHRVGAVLWQAIYFCLAGGCMLGFLWFVAPWLFLLAGHSPAIMELEIRYFRVLTMGSIFMLFGGAVGCFYSGRGVTRPVMLANLVAMVINIPLDYALIFGAWGMPEMGIAGAGIATVVGWAVTFIFLALPTFTQAHDRLFGVLRSWRFDRQLFMRMMRYGLPSGVNCFFEIFAIMFFVFAVGRLGGVELAATNIVFSIESIAFLPLLGLNIAVSTMVGQAIGAGKPDNAAIATSSTLHLALGGMLCSCILFVVFPGVLLDLFRPQDMSVADFLPVRELGTILMRFVAFYCLADAYALVYFGAVKGAGDTNFVMWAMTVSCVCMIVVMLGMQWVMDVDVITLWVILSVYGLGLCATAVARYHSGRWRGMRVVETPPGQ